MNLAQILVFASITIMSRPALLYPQEMKRDSRKEVVRDDYITDQTGLLLVRVYGVQKYNTFSLYDDSVRQSIDYSPNGNFNIGLGVNYKWIGVWAAFSFPFINGDDDIYGKTERFDFQTNIFTRRFLLDGYIQYYKGFYISNPEIHIGGWEEGMAYPQRSDIATGTLGINGIYIFNHHRYSARAAFIQNEIQRRNAGSFLLGGLVSLFATAADSAYLPLETALRFKKENNITSASVGNFGLLFGYTYTFIIWKKFNVSLTLMPSISVQRFSYETGVPGITGEGSSLSGGSMFRMALVYNSEKSYTGLTAISANYTMNREVQEHNDELSYSLGSVRIFYGRKMNLGKK
ncbi:MAG: DUF4421 family protein [Bacteroidales bacterium]|nr:DUF4421 family protein [Bacteroidales bacterium]